MSRKNGETIIKTLQGKNKIIIIKKTSQDTNVNENRKVSLKPHFITNNTHNTIINDKNITLNHNKSFNNVNSTFSIRKDFDNSEKAVKDNESHKKCDGLLNKMNDEEYKEVMNDEEYKEVMNGIEKDDGEYKLTKINSDELVNINEKLSEQTDKYLQTGIPKFGECHSKDDESLTHHSGSTSSKPGKRYTCDRCGKIARSRFKFLDHLFNHDNSVKPYECPVCGIRIGYSTSVTRHLQMHLRDIGCLAIEKKSFLCPSCGKEYRDKASLVRHETMVHLKVGHSCIECHKTFSSRQALRQHCTRHTGELTHACDQCDKRYGNASSLHNHKKTHASVKLSCTVCLKTFSLKHHLKRHMAKHTRFNNFNCSFMNSNSVKENTTVSRLNNNTIGKSKTCTSIKGNDNVVSTSKNDS